MQNDEDKTKLEIDEEMQQIDQFFAGERARKDEIKYAKQPMINAQLAKFYASLQVTQDSKSTVQPNIISKL
jgi:adenylate cyclase